MKRRVIKFLLTLIVGIFLGFSKYKDLQLHNQVSNVLFQYIHGIQKSLINKKILCVLRKRNAQLDQNEKHRKEDLIIGHIFEDFQADELIFVLFKIKKTNILQHL
jgi:hypothetical protein